MEKAKVAPRGLYKRVGQLHQHNVPEWSMHLVNGTFTFSPINASRVLQPHKDALVLTLGLWVRREKGSGWSGQLSWPFTNVSLQVDGLLTVHLREPRTITIRVQWSHDDFSGWPCVARPSWLNHPERTILSGQGFVPFQCHYEMCLASQNESRFLYIPSNGELPHWGGTNRSPWQLASHAPMQPSGIRFRTSS